jgi:hypothetical protein
MSVNVKMKKGLGRILAIGLSAAAAAGLYAAYQHRGELKEFTEKICRKLRRSDEDDSAMFADTDGDGLADAIFVDTNGDGVPDAILADTDGDGLIDTVVTEEEPGTKPEDEKAFGK